jgi:hypothetical protein
MAIRHGIVCWCMADLELKRSPDDRRLYALEGVGTVRVEGWRSPRATAETGSRSWHFTRHGFWRRAVEATDAFGGNAGMFAPRARRRGGRGGRGGALQWGGRDFMLRPASVGRERFALAVGDRELVVFDGKGWGRQPVRVTAEDPTALDPGLLLFTAFVVQGLADDAGSARPATASAGTAETWS